MSATPRFAANGFAWSVAPSSGTFKNASGADHTVIELTHNWGQAEPYDLGNGFGHLAVGVPDIYGTCAALEKDGVKIPRSPGPMKHGGSVIAFVEDPDGYKIELIETK